ncbi:MAG: MlaD family protein [Solirubrobacterales bacterium]
MRRTSQAVSAASARVARHRIILGLIVLAIGGFLAYIAWISVNGPPFQQRYKIEAVIAADSPIVKPGGTVRMAGKLAGTITAVEADGPNQRVSMELSPEFAPVGRDATARVRVRSVVYLTYIEIDPGDRGNPMPQGEAIPLAQTSSGVDLLQVVQLFDQRTREELRKSVVNLGEGVAGRGEDLNAALLDLHPALRAGIPEIQALTSEPGALASSIASARRVAAGLGGERADDVSSLIVSGDAAVGAIADRHLELGAALEQLRPFEDELLRTAPLADPLLADAATLARRLAPAARSLRRGLPRFNHLLSLGGELRRESGRIGRRVRPVLKLAGPRLYALYPTVASLQPILSSLQSTLAVLLPYSADITLAGQSVVSATGVPYPEGQTAPGNKALRFIPIMDCHRPRDPYPAPGQALKDSATC